MLNIHNNPSAVLRVRWPKNDAEVISVGTTFIAYEGSLPAPQQVQDIPLARIQAAHTSAQAGVTGAGGGEAARAIAAETLRQNYLAAKPLLETAIHHLNVKYRANLAQLELWGLETVLGPTGIRVRKPRGQRGWIAFLQAYVTQESALPVADQLTAPALAQMQTLHTNIQDALRARNEGRNTREISVQGRTAATQELDSLLRIACAIIVTARYDGEITNELQHWGFNVVARPPSQGQSTPPESEPPVAS